MNHMKECFSYDECALQFDYLPDVCMDFTKIRIVLVNEIVPQIPQDDFYGDPKTSPYVASARYLLKQAGIQDDLIALLDQGIYISNAVKYPKEETSILRSVIERDSYLLEKELQQFPNLELVMAMGDVAIKSINMIAKRNLKRTVIPSGSTYKLRKHTYTYESIRVMPSYIMTGTNLKIEKSKRDMIVEDFQIVKAILASS